MISRSQAAPLERQKTPNTSVFDTDTACTPHLIRSQEDWPWLLRRTERQYHQGQPGFRVEDLDLDVGPFGGLGLDLN